MTAALSERLGLSPLSVARPESSVLSVGKPCALLHSPCNLAGTNESSSPRSGNRFLCYMASDLLIGVTPSFVTCLGARPSAGRRSWTSTSAGDGRKKNYEDALQVLALTGHAQALEDSSQVQGEGARSMTRSPEDAYRAHLLAVNTGDLEAILKNYADDVVVLTAQGPLEGRTGVEAFFEQAFSLLPQVRVSVKQVVSSGAALLVWWGAESPAGRVDDGVDTFVFEGGLIKLQSISFSPQLNQ